ncbi:MAG: hypothetical protein ACI4FV_06285 [Lachnospiraceae bacterium]
MGILSAFSPQKLPTGSHSGVSVGILSAFSPQKLPTGSHSGVSVGILSAFLPQKLPTDSHSGVSVGILSAFSPRMLPTEWKIVIRVVSAVSNVSSKKRKYQNESIYKVYTHIKDFSFHSLFTDNLKKFPIKPDNSHMNISYGNFSLQMTNLFLYFQLT